MPKHEKGTPKEIANRCKSKGLQKLRWFCQMCQKQCRDQNGFKCHLTSESHQRQLLLFAENQNSYLRQFSREFEANFMHILRHTFGSKRVKANDVYQDYIRDKGHVHMNSTVWHTLTGFVLYLGKSGKCKIDQNEKGWHIQYIDQEEELRKQKLQARAKQEKDDEERMTEQLERQIERGKQIAAEKGDDEEEERELKEFVKDEDVKIAFSLNSNLIRPVDVKPDVKNIPTQNIFQNIEKSIKKEIKKEIFDQPTNYGGDRARPPSPKPSTSHKRSALEELMAEEEMRKEKMNRKDYWLRENIIVKVVSKKLGAAYLKKGHVIGLRGNYTARLKLDDGQVVEADQEQLETVIPALNRDMLIVNGAYADHLATLMELLPEQFSLKLRIKHGTHNGRVVHVAYEDASKYKKPDDELKAK